MAQDVRSWPCLTFLFPLHSGKGSRFLPRLENEVVFEYNFPMPTLTRSIEIFVHAPIQMVFDSISDLTRHPEWSGGNLRVEAVSPGPIAVGKEYLSHGDVGNVQKGRANTVKVMEYAPPHRFAFVSNDPDFGKVQHVVTLVQEGDSVRVTRMLTLSLNLLTAFGFGLFVYPLIGKPSLKMDFAALKKKLEA
jgi:uncharacterized protein YndB with AHSA1/START domain